MTTVWTPQTPVDQAWVDKLAVPLPQPGTLAVLDSYVVLPQIPPRAQATAGDPYQVLDLSGNVLGDRYPHTFSILSSTFPGGSVQIEPNGRFLYGFAAQGSIGVSYSAVIKVVDANLQTVFFTLVTKDLGSGPLVLSGFVAGRIPNAHFGVPFAWQLVYSGGTAPLTFTFQGLNLAALGFTFDSTSGLLLGALTTHTNSDNLVQLSGYNAGHDPFSDALPDAQIAAQWKFDDP